MCRYQGKSLLGRAQSKCQAPEKAGCSASWGWRSRQEASVALGAGRAGAEREDRAAGQGGLLRALKVFGVFSETGCHGEFWLLFWKLTLTSLQVDHEAGRSRIWKPGEHLGSSYNMSSDISYYCPGGKCHWKTWAVRSCRILDTF